LLAMVVNKNAASLAHRGALESIAGKPAPTGEVSAQGFFDCLNDSGIIRRRTRRESRQYATVLAEQEFFEIPGDITREFGTLARQQAVQLMTLMTVDFQLAGQRKGHAIVEAAKRLDLLLGARLLPGNWLHGKPSTLKPLPLYC
jgi:hypothetical protein